MIKKYLSLFFMLLSFCAAVAQTFNGSSATVSEFIKLNGFKFETISNDTSEALKRTTAIPTEWTMKMYVAKYFAEHEGGPGGGGPESDPIYTAGIVNYYNKTQSDARYLQSFTESDPVWLSDKPSYLTSASAASIYSVLSHTHAFSSLTSKPTTLSGYGITDAYPLTGNPSGFISSYTETDPVYSASSWFGTTNNSSNWNTAYGWGNHAGLYPLLSGSYTNPSWIASLPWSKITSTPSYLLAADSVLQTGYKTNHDATQDSTVITNSLRSNTVIGSGDSTALQVIKNTSLSYALLANKKYEINGVLLTSCDTTTGFFVGLNAPAGTTLYAGSLAGISTSNVATTDVRIAPFGSIHSTATSLAFNRTSTINGTIRISALIQTSATPGNVVVIFKNGGLTGTTKASYIEAGSWIKVTQVN